MVVVGGGERVPRAPPTLTVALTVALSHVTVNVKQKYFPANAPGKLLLEARVESCRGEGGGLAQPARDTRSLGDRGALAPRLVTGTRRRRSPRTRGFASPGEGRDQHQGSPQASPQAPFPPALPCSCHCEITLQHNHFYLKKTPTKLEKKQTTQP